jgi:hypothetical protein
MKSIPSFLVIVSMTASASAESPPAEACEPPAGSAQAAAKGASQPPRRPVMGQGVSFFDNGRSAAPAATVCAHAINTKGTGATGRVAGGPEAKPSAHDVHELEKITFSVIAEAKDAPAGAAFLRIRSTADSDGDGRGDEAVLKLVCAGKTLQEAAIWPLASPGEAVPFVGKWGAATPQLGSRTYQLEWRRKVPAGGEDRWSTVVTGTSATYSSSAPAPVSTSGKYSSPINITKGRSVPCPSGVKATKSRSNIQNN